MIFRDAMTPRGIQDVHHGIFTAEGPQPPAKAHLALHLHEDQPARLIGLLVMRLAGGAPTRLHCPGGERRPPTPSTRGSGRRPRPPPRSPPTPPPPRAAE